MYIEEWKDNQIYSKKSVLINDFRCEGTINKLHAGSNVKSQYVHSLIIFTQHGKGHVREVSIHFWQALFRLNKLTWITIFLFTFCFRPLLSVPDAKMLPQQKI